MKTLARSLIRRTGFELLRRSDDPILRSLLDTHNDLRLHPGDLTHWSRVLPRLASLSHLRESLRAGAFDLLLDVGANRGQFALDARRVGYTGEIISFEPLSAHQAGLRALAESDGRWRIFPIALGGAAAELALNVYRDDTFSSLHAVNVSASQNFGSLVALDHVERVPVRTLDDVVAELALPPSCRIFLKTDTQGHDGAVLAGATRTLQQVHVVLTEATVAPLYDGASTLEEINARLLPLGFVRSGIFPIGYSPGTLKLLELDCFFVRPETAG